MRKLFYCTLAIGLLLIQPAQAQSPLPESIQTYQPVGGGTLTYFFIDAYDATLFAPEGTYKPNHPFALELHYLVSIEGDDIAERSIEEMRGLGYDNEPQLASWLEGMNAIFPNVEDGDRLTGVYAPGQPTQFYKGATLIGTVEDPEFGNAFFGIWLNENTSEPTLRKQLLGSE